ncbi:hypothetical protein JCM19298_2857 [Nonlabens ulvanivorans]|nr:hypothetical protein JCM19297_2647 [Nonlabens ulvanivorans]GAK92369.1 hypothetical protein JCM19298_2857 [Nonlabens ulvanivorans]
MIRVVIDFIIKVLEVVDIVNMLWNPLSRKRNQPNCHILILSCGIANFYRLSS